MLTMIVHFLFFFDKDVFFFYFFHMRMNKWCALLHVLLFCFSVVTQSATGQAEACVGCLARFCLS